MNQAEKARAFKALHERDKLFIIPNPWDGASAKILASQGFAALTTTSAGLAFVLGRPDGGVTREQSLWNAQLIVNSVDIPVAAEEISRHHARLQVTPDGVLVEDLSSANGTFINDKRVQSGMLKPGEELRLDTVRFMLVAPGMDAKQQGSAARAESAKAAEPAPSGSGKAIGIVVAIVVIAAIAFGVARHFGVV